MDSTTEKMYLENIEEFVMDENKIVTYKWLSQTLDLHVNTAKQLLFKFVQGKKDVYITYLLGGMLADGSGGKILVVRENEVDSAKLQFKCITSEHIYSIQKARELKDLSILFGVDNPTNNKSNEDRLGAITCKNANKRVCNDMATLRKAGFKPVEVPKPPPLKKSVIDPPKVVPVAKSEDAASVEPKSETVAEKPKTIASMFTAQSKKITTTKTPVAAKNNKASIGAFFTKLTEKPKPIEKPQDVLQANSIKESVKKEVVEEEKMDTTEEKSEVKINGEAKLKKASTPAQDKKKKENEKSSEKTQKSAVNGKKKKRSSDKGQKPAKKRKRIMVMSDSDVSDDDIFGKDESSDEDVRPPSPDVPPEDAKQSSDEDIIPATPVVKAEQNGRRRSRKRKAVDKTFTDEDGFITTTKEYVFESCSEEEDVEVQAKENTVKKAEEKKVTEKKVEEEKKAEEEEEESPSDKKKSKKKKPAAKKKEVPVATPKAKQQSIMNFFTKN